MKVFLLGFMGTGKTYWGKLWSEQHGFQFFDLDKEIEKTAGMTISKMFERFGESYFREKERESLLSFGTHDNFILSTGGGTPCFYDNMDWMNKTGLTIYLHSPIAVLKDRLIKEKDHRPLIKSLREDEIEKYIKESLQKREKYYKKAHIILSTESVSDINFGEIIRKYV
ncbi:MAG: shikimate kinase [Chitinophagaceae bacterium]|nr:shikimate kinase [Chitinophagaceae bacterium]